MQRHNNMNGLEYLNSNNNIEKINENLGFDIRKKTNESKIYENNRQSKNGLLSFDEFLIENLNFKF